MKDITGQQIQPNDKIAYATRDNCYSYLVLAIVLKVEEKRIYIQRKEKKEPLYSGGSVGKPYKPVWLHHPNRIIIISF